MPNFDTLRRELTFKAIKSSGPGGQHVNKTASKVVVQFDVKNSQAFTEEEKILILEKLASKLSNESGLIMDSGETRSQHKNKEIVTARILNAISTALVKPKLRKKSKPSKASKLKRLREKKFLAEKKQQRQKPLTK